MVEARVSSFAPVVDERARVLILGSMPGIASLSAQEYYAHPRNAFWPIMGTLFQFDVTLGYSARLEKLKASGVALWDVLQQCERDGSLDSSIVTSSQQLNSFAAFFQAYPGIQAVFCNGNKAYQEFTREAQRLKTEDSRFEALHIQSLPSTSPAHASMTFEKKLIEWRSLLLFL
ncbi:DNA-deoxyinosine glycosylase [Nitrincola tibetensis]|uniref:DNA-deoxyinosine glycosylase n=1 Tax=Nitrincola tibetensis TaxID=2219697 RepID=A0A364NKS2_9GAMM|nr:DNA-deoxyinosine glycosylase [Nitrincola tibetensis]RAU17696.1 DNA-deoxyinosine glycosylase [Nitrincola tibetensis]